MNLEEMFKDAWEEEISKREKDSPSFTRDQFVATGRASAKHGGKRSESWWLEEGPKMVQRWLDWRKEQKWKIVEFDGEPAIEVECRFTLPGDIPVLAFIDRVFATTTGELVVVDLKTGRQPETPEQLGLYATALEIVHGVRSTWGYFWDAQKGTHSQPYLLDMYTPEYMAGVFSEAIAGINAGSFMAKPANACRNWCGVAYACAAVGGAEAGKHDPLLQIRK